MGKNRTVSRIWLLALVLFCLNLFSLRFTGRTLAKYTTGVSAGSTARVAAWDVSVSDLEITDAEIFAGLSDYTSAELSTYGITGEAADSHGYVVSGYRFTVQTGEATDTTGSLSVQISAADDRTGAWPEGLSAALYRVNGSSGSESYVFIAESSTGTFENVQSVAPGTAFTGTYIVCFKAPATTAAGTCQIEVLASMDQAD